MFLPIQPDACMADSRPVGSRTGLTSSNYKLGEPNSKERSCSSKRVAPSAGHIGRTDSSHPSPNRNMTEAGRDHNKSACDRRVVSTNQPPDVPVVSLNEGNQTSSNPTKRQHSVDLFHASSDREVRRDLRPTSIAEHHEQQKSPLENPSGPCSCSNSDNSAESLGNTNREFRTPIELFLASVAGWEPNVVRLVHAA